jgi:hypothetical protein
MEYMRHVLLGLLQCDVIITEKKPSATERNSLLLRKNSLNQSYMQINACKHKVKFTLEQTTKAQRGSRSIALLFP